MTKVETIYEGVFRLPVDGQERLATINLAPNVQVYSERLVKVDDVQYRLWDPFRSKLAAAMIKGLERLPIKQGTCILYLGVSTGTTASHVSDILGEEGVLYGVEVSGRVAREFVDRVAKHRRNVIPIVEDARRPGEYVSMMGRVDVVYCDIAQPDQTDIAILNCKAYLKRGGSLLLAVKSRSIDVTKEPEQIFKEEVVKLEEAGFKIQQVVDLEPFDRDHAFIYATWKGV